MKNGLVIIGAILIVLGIFAYAYTVTVTDEGLGGLYEDEDIETPYRTYSYPLIIVGIVLVIVGVVYSDKKVYPSP
ncbi:MAG: hypothetical protein WC548_04480 [Candidatus Pacearchaeota archaeon]